MRILAAVILAVAVALGVAGCHRDDSVPASANPRAACPHGDAGRVKDTLLLPPAQWVCVR